MKKSCAYKASMTKLFSKASAAAVCAGGLLMISGCNKTPGGQVVAVMNNQEITQLELQAEAAQENLPANLDPRVISPMLLQRIIDRNIMADLAREQGLDRSPQFVTQRRQLEQSLLAELALRKLTGNMRTPSPAEVKTYIDSNPILFANRENLKMDIVHFSKPLSRQKVLELTALPSMDQIEQRLRQENAAPQRLTTVLDTGTIDIGIAKQIAALPPGTIFDLSAGGMTFIGTVVARQSASVPPNLWPKIAANSIMNDRTMKTVATALSDLRSRAKITYAPAYRPPGAK